MDTATSADVVVIGGGVSGLVSASMLRQRDSSLRVIVLEAQDKIGGRIETRQASCAGKAVALDVGGDVIDAAQKNVMQLLDQLGLQVDAMPRNQELSDIFWGSQMYAPRVRFGGSAHKSWNVFKKLDLKFLIYKIDSLASRIDAKFPYKNHQLALELDGQTVRSFLASNCYFTLTRDIIESVVLQRFGRDSSDISLLWFVTYLSSAGGLAVALDNSEEACLIRGGAHKVCERLATQIGWQNIALNHPVCAITRDADKVYVTTKNQQMFACRKVICAIPPSAVNLIEFLPCLPATLRSVVSGMSMGHMIKFAIVYKKPFWRDHELSGRVVCLSGWQMVPRCEGLPVTATIQTSGPTKEPAILTGIIAGRSALQWSQVDGDTLKQYILHSLSDILGSEAHTTQHVEIAHWHEAMPGCGLSSGPTCAPRTGGMAFIHQLREPRGNLHFAGSETATRWVGHISGAIQSGQRSAIEVLDDLRPQVLTAHDYSLLKEAFVATEEKETVARRKKSKKSNLRWAVGVPAAVLFVGYTAYFLRDKYCHLLVPHRL